MTEGNIMAAVGLKNVCPQSRLFKCAGLIVHGVDSHQSSPTGLYFSQTYLVKLHSCKQIVFFNKGVGGVCGACMFVNGAWYGYLIGADDHDVLPMMCLLDLCTSSAISHHF